MPVSVNSPKQAVGPPFGLKEVGAGAGIPSDEPDPLGVLGFERRSKLSGRIERS